jgi:hypothetical protein
MKIINKTESMNDTAELEILKASATKLENSLNKIKIRMGEIIYKYDTAKMDYTSKPKKA